MRIKWDWCCGTQLDIFAGVDLIAYDTYGFKTTWAVRVRDGRWYDTYNQEFTLRENEITKLGYGIVDFMIYGFNMKPFRYSVIKVEKVETISQQMVRSNIIQEQITISMRTSLIRSLWHGLI